MGRKVDVDDLIDANEVAEILGLAHRNTVSEYQARYPEMPRPVLDRRKGRLKLWLRPEVDRWATGHRYRAAARGRPRLRPERSLPKSIHPNPCVPGPIRPSTRSRAGHALEGRVPVGTNPAGGGGVSPALPANCGSSRLNCGRTSPATRISETNTPTLAVRARPNRSARPLTSFGEAHAASLRTAPFAELDTQPSRRSRLRSAVNSAGAVKATA